jgi:Rab-like protein 3
MEASDKIKVLVLGDSGVGKSCLVNLICNQNQKSNSSWTIGCSIDVRAHEFAEGTPKQKTFYLELWDVGGNKTHSVARHIFFSQFQAMILVHDLTNSKSRLNLRKWLTEVLYASGDAHPPSTRSTSSFSSSSPLLSMSSSSADSFEAFDHELFVDQQVPTLLVGTKLDLIEPQSLSRCRSSSLADQLGADEMFVDCLSNRSLAPGSTNSVTLSRFFDKVIEVKCRTSASRNVLGLFDRSASRSAHGNALLSSRLPRHD